MTMQEAIQRLLDGQHLSGKEMQCIMRILMTGGATDAQIGGFLVALRCKGESVDEIVAAASVMRDLAVKVPVHGDLVIDTCGTGGDGARTFNISTASAFVVAAAGGQVAKHGSRSVSSSSGSADVLEAAGVNLDLSAEQVGRCIDKIGVGFLFAPKYHDAMKYAIGPRREMGVRTLFNLLGPLSNPAGAPHQLIGVYSRAWLEPLAKVLKQLGSRHVLVVNAEDGLDEISIAAPTHVAELHEGRVSRYKVTPEQFGLRRHSLESLAVDGADASLAMIKDVLTDQPGPARDIVLLNAGAALYAANISGTLADGVSRAGDVVASGAALDKLDALVTYSQNPV